MKHSEGTFEGYENVNLFYQSWLPDSGIKAILIIVHGLAEHSGRYMNLVNYFVPKGYGIFGLDQRGHGKSDGLRGDVTRFTHYLRDLKIFMDIILEEHPDTKKFIVGHSIGGTIAIAYTVFNQKAISGLITSAAVIKANASMSSPTLVAATRMLAMFLPKTGVKRIDASAISHDSAVVKDYVSDPLVYRGKIRARMGAQLLDIMRRIPERAPQISIPILIMHGSDDRLAEPEGSKMLYEKVSSIDKTLKLYGSFYHEIFNEPENSEVLSDIESWLGAHT